jgi:Mor family transcriptional regulator
MRGCMTEHIPENWEWLLEIEETELASAVPDNVRELIELMGGLATIRLLARFEGQQIYLQRLDGAFRKLRDARIRAEFDGNNHAYLCRRYGLSVNRIREILAEPQYQQVGLFG